MARLARGTLSFPHVFGLLLVLSVSLLGCEPAETVQLMGLADDSMVPLNDDAGRPTVLDSGNSTSDSETPDGSPVLDGSDCSDLGIACEPTQPDCQNDSDCDPDGNCLGGQCHPLGGECQTALTARMARPVTRACASLSDRLNAVRRLSVRGRTQCGTATGCTAEPSCLATYGGPCESQCECSGQLICQSSHSPLR